VAAKLPRSFRRNHRVGTGVAPLPPYHSAIGVASRLCQRAMSDAASGVAVSLYSSPNVVKTLSFKSNRVPVAFSMMT